MAERKETTPELTEMVEHYLICALWSSLNYEEDGKEPRNFDADYGPEDVSADLYKAAVDDCVAFVEMARAKGIDPSEEQTWEQIGHDFWLTRNHHGAGFWDRGLKHGQELTDIAHRFPGVDLFAVDGEVTA